MGFPGYNIREPLVLHADLNLIARPNRLRQVIERFKRHKEATVHGVPIKDSGIAGCHDRLNARDVETDGGMFTGRSAAKVFSGHDNLINGTITSVLDEFDISLREAGLCIRDAGE